MLKLITNPNEFFADLKRKEIQLKKPMLIIVLPLALIISIYQYIITITIAQMFPSEAAKLLLIFGIIGVIGSFISIIAMWPILTTIMYGLSVFFGGKGNFRRTFEFVGYGFLPSLIGSVVTFPVSIYNITHTKISHATLTQLAENPSALEKIISQLIPDTLIYSNLIINLALTAWSLTIWTFAIKHAREIELRKAFITALIPTTLLEIYQVWNILKVL